MTDEPSHHAIITQAVGVQLEPEQLEPGPRGGRGGGHEPARPLEGAEDRLQPKVSLHEVAGEAEPPRRRGGHERRRGLQWVRMTFFMRRPNRFGNLGARFV